MSDTTDLSSSPERHMFQKKLYKDIVEDPAATDDKKKSAEALIDFYEEWETKDKERELTEEWQKNNLEYDLRTTDWILDKVRSSDSYAQNIYAALCNNDFIKHDMFQVLKEETWSCSWRHAGGIVADMRGEGDYIDWYCSGMGGLNSGYNPENDETFEQWRARTKFASEGDVTDEIREDLRRLQWSVWKENNDE
jgi:hypothetical protein